MFYEVYVQHHVQVPSYIPFMHPRRPPQSRRQMSASFLLRRVVVGTVCRTRMEVRLLFSHQMFCWLISKQSRI